VNLTGRGNYSCHRELTQIGWRGVRRAVWDSAYVFAKEGIQTGDLGVQKRGGET